MKIREIQEKFKMVDEILDHPKDLNDVKRGENEFYELQRELEKKGFPKHNFMRLAYSIRYGWKTIKDLNKKSETTPLLGQHYCFSGSCYA